MSQVISAANHPSKNESFEQNNIPTIVLTKFVHYTRMKLDVVILNCKIILNPEFGDQPEMIKKIKLFSWVHVDCGIHLFKNLISYFDN